MNPQQPPMATETFNTTNMDRTFVPYRLAGDYLSRRIQETNGDIESPVIGIICGSGLSELSSTMQDGPTLTIPYADIPGFPAHCTVAGHKGELVLGRLSSDNGGSAGTPCICFRGRFHSYEGHDMKTVVLPVYVMRCLQTVRIVIITNAAGGLNPDYSVGDICAISDHLALPQLAGKNALIGPNDDELGPRFPPTSNAYPDVLRAVAQQAAHDLHFDFFRSHATYCFVSGPMYESKAECRFLQSLGGDAVGMSTVPEVVAAHHCEMQVLCLSLITNKVVMQGDSGGAVASHAEVLEAVAQRSVQMQALVQRIVLLLHEQVLPKLAPLRKVSLLVPEHLKNQQEQDDGVAGKSSNQNSSNKKTIYSALLLDHQDPALTLRALGVASLVFAAGLFLGYQAKPGPRTR